MPSKLGCSGRSLAFGLEWKTEVCLDYNGASEHGDESPSAVRPALITMELVSMVMDLLCNCIRCISVSRGTTIFETNYLRIVKKLKLSL